MKIFARWELARDRLNAAEPALLLEGVWPAEASGAWRWSLDENIDVRHAWIDHHAAELAEQLAGDDPLSSAHLHAAKLRYYLVKLLRVVAFFDQVQPLAPNATLELHVQRGRDEDFADVVAICAARSAAAVEIHWTEPSRAAAKAPASPPSREPWWRRLATSLHRWTDRPAAMRDAAQPRVILCGNPRCLDGVGNELLRRGVQTWWLYEKFALRSWLQWRPRGVHQLCCDHQTTERPLPLPSRERAGVRGSPASSLTTDIDTTLESIAHHWLATVTAATANHDSQVLAQLAAHFRTVRPTHVVVDQDQTPFNRAFIALARQHGARSIVVQHGTPYVRFGFAPLEADLFAAWGETSREQLLHWGVPAERIRVTGFPGHDSLKPQLRRLRNSRRRNQFLLLASTPPRDERPDVVTYHLTTDTHADMLRAAFGSLAAIPDAQLVVKLHPRDRDATVLRSILAEFPQLRARLVWYGSLARWLKGVRCVLSCASSAGIEATLSGVPVIQLMPRGSGDLICDRSWGLVGSARSREELNLLLNDVLQNDRRPRPAQGPTAVFGDDSVPAARRVVDALFASDPPATPAIVPPPHATRPLNLRT